MSELPNMPEEIVKAIAAIRDYQAALTDDQRTDLWYLVHESYCPLCGSKTDGKTCYCSYDSRLEDWGDE